MKISTGVDVVSQTDGRERYQNIDGTRGEATLSQDETFNNYAGYVLSVLSIDQWTITGGLRYDINDLGIEDFFLEDGADNSGDVDLKQLSPSLGVSYRLNEKWTTSLGYSDSYETPTLSEYSANPDNTSGFNQNLNPLFYSNIEWTLKYYDQEKFFRFSAFNTSGQDELLPFELAEFPGRSFFRNSGSTSRWGIEAESEFKVHPQHTINSSVSYLDATFSEYVLDDVDLEGLSLPGIPDLTGFLSYSYQPETGQQGLHIRGAASYIGRLYADNNNNEKVDSYVIADLSIGYSIYTSQLKFYPFFKLYNALGTSYFDNIRINAFGGRYYEAAPPRQWVIGFNVRWE